MAQPFLRSCGGAHSKFDTMSSQWHNVASRSRSSLDPLGVLIRRAPNVLLWTRKSDGPESVEVYVMGHTDPIWETKRLQDYRATVLRPSDAKWYAGKPVPALGIRVTPKVGR